MCESVSAASGQISLHAIQFNMATKASALCPRAYLVLLYMVQNRSCTVVYNLWASLLRTMHNILYNYRTCSCECFRRAGSVLPLTLLLGS